MVPTAMDNGLAIEVAGLSKRFGPLTAVDGISFAVRKGEFFGFLGPNGAGKTTTIRMLTGIISKSEGEARVLGHPAGSIEAKQRSGVVPEQSNVYMDLSAWQNLMLTAELYRVPSIAAKARAEELLQQLGLGERKDSQARTYSLGMRKRLLLALALIGDPEIVFLDEPTSGLDVQSTRFIRALLIDFKKQGKTFFLTTHNMNEAADLCDRVAIINSGRLVALDTPESLRINAGKVSLIDVSFDQPVSGEDLKALPGVLQVESARAIEIATQMKAMAAMAGMGAGKKGPGMGGPGMAGMEPGGKRQPGPPGQATGQAGTPHNRYRLHTEDTGLMLAALVDFSRAHALKMNVLSVNPPSFEDAFVMLTQEANREK